MKNRTKLGALLAAGLLTFGITGIAFANTLHQSDQLPIAWDDAGFQGSTDECAGADLQPGEVLWHFVHTGTGSGNLPATLSATFTTAGTVVVNGFVNGSSIVMYNVVTGPDTLTAAADTIVNDGNLNLSHICSGGPAPSETPSGSGAGASDTPAPSDTPAGTGAGDTNAPTSTPGGGGGGDQATQPPTNTLGSNGSGPGDGAWLLVVGLGVLLASVVVLTPARAKSRR